MEQNTTYGVFATTIEMAHITGPVVYSDLLRKHGREDFNTSHIVDENASHANDIGRLKAENLDLKRKLRAARSEVTRYQKEYIDLLERRGQ